jgi:DNA-binding NtrC family response regulator
MSKVRLLIVDDDDEDFSITRDRLGEIKDGPVYDLEWVTTYAAAVQCLSQNDYALCITDFNLRAGKTGLDLVGEMTGAGCRVPFIVLTSQATMSLCIEAGKRGAVDFLDKGSLTAEKLGGAVQRALRGAQTAETLRQAGEQLRRVSEE